MARHSDDYDDLDFEELDRAVSELSGEIADDEKSAKAGQPADAKSTPASSGKVDAKTAPAAQPGSAKPTNLRRSMDMVKPAAPKSDINRPVPSRRTPAVPAEKTADLSLSKPATPRRITLENATTEPVKSRPFRGKFMDLVHPSSDMSSAHKPNLAPDDDTHLSEADARTILTERLGQTGDGLQATRLATGWIFYRPHRPGQTAEADEATATWAVADNGRAAAAKPHERPNQLLRQLQMAESIAESVPASVQVVPAQTASESDLDVAIDDIAGADVRADDYETDDYTEESEAVGAELSGKKLDEMDELDDADFDRVFAPVDDDELAKPDVDADDEDKTAPLDQMVAAVDEDAADDADLDEIMADIAAPERKPAEQVDKPETDQTNSAANSTAVVADEYDSPFLPDVKVEKKPLGAAAPTGEKLLEPDAPMDADDQPVKEITQTNFVTDFINDEIQGDHGDFNFKSRRARKADSDWNIPAGPDHLAPANLSEQKFRANDPRPNRAAVEHSLNSARYRVSDTAQIAESRRRDERDESMTSAEKPFPIWAWILITILVLAAGGAAGAALYLSGWLG